MLKHELPLSPATVEFSEEDKDRLDIAVAYFEEGEVGKGEIILNTFGQECAAFVGARTNAANAFAIGNNLVTNLIPEVAVRVQDAYEVELLNQALRPAVDNLETIGERK